MDWLQIISIVFGVLGGSGALVTYLLYSKQLKRFKNAEAFEKEVQALKAAMSVGAADNVPGRPDHELAAVLRGPRHGGEAVGAVAAHLRGQELKE